MKPRRRNLLVALAIAGVGLGVGAAWMGLAPLQPRINEDAYEQIRAGMTQTDVEALLGAPPGDYCSDELTAAFSRVICIKSRVFEHDADGREVTWGADGASLTVCFSACGTVAAKHYAVRTVGGRIPLSAWERIRRWLGW
jgi:hypothetical protein